MRMNQTDTPSIFPCTLVILKPDCLENPIINTQVQQLLLERSDSTVLDRRVTTPFSWKNVFEDHYAKHKGEEYFEPLIQFMNAGVCRIFLLKSNVKMPQQEFIDKVRRIVGSLNDPDSIRGRWADPDVKRRNIIHASDSIDEYEREKKIWFY